MSEFLKIIVVDDEDDKQLLQHAVKEAGIANPVVYLEGGEQLRPGGRELYNQAIKFYQTGIRYESVKGFLVRKRHFARVRRMIFVLT